MAVCDIKNLAANETVQIWRQEKQLSILSLRTMLWPGQLKNQSNTCLVQESKTRYEL
jgi:hypothetical protein